VHDDVVGELAQRICAAVPAVGCGLLDAAQAWNGDRVEQAVVGLRIEVWPSHINGARPRGMTREEERWIGVAADVTGAAADPRAAGQSAQDRWRAERQIAQGDQEILLGAQPFHGQDLPRHLERRLAEIGARRQDPRPVEQRLGMDRAGEREPGKGDPAHARRGVHA
jgi:hypothetical protein